MQAATATGGRVAAEKPRRRRRIRFPRVVTWLRMSMSVAAGLLMYVSFPPSHLWWLAPIAFAFFVLPLLGRKARAGFGYGLLFALAWLLPLFSWLDDLLGPAFGPWPWLAMSVASALLIAITAAAVAVTTVLPAIPVWIGALFVGIELLRQNFPFDGFPWGRLAFSQPAGVFVPLASVGGAPLVTFAVAVTGSGLAILIRRVWRVYRARGHEHVPHTRRRLIAPSAAIVLPVIAGLATMPTISDAPQAGTVTVAAVQGSAPDTGLALLHQGALLWRNHVMQARALAHDVATGAVPKPDLVIFPESIAELRSDDSAAVAGLARLLHAPVAVGARVMPPDQRGRNVIIGWDPTRGETGEYAKQKLVPYGEYVPLRALATWLSPFVGELSNLVPGDQPGVIQLGKAKVGFAICYEVAFDGPLRGATQDGAQLLAVPTNNEWYGRTAAGYQQLGMARLRAVEHGRAVVVAATTGVSAIIRPDGSLITESKLYQRTDLEARVPLRTTITLADRVGAWPEWALTVLGLVGLGLGIGARTGRRRSARRALTGKDTDGPDGPAARIG